MKITKKTSAILASMIIAGGMVVGCSSSGLQEIEEQKEQDTKQEQTTQETDKIEKAIELLYPNVENTWGKKYKYEFVKTDDRLELWIDMPQEEYVSYNDTEWEELLNNINEGTKLSVELLEQNGITDLTFTMGFCNNIHDGTYDGVYGTSYNGDYVINTRVINKNKIKDTKETKANEKMKKIKSNKMLVQGDEYSIDIVGVNIEGSNLVINYDYTNESNEDQTPIWKVAFKCYQNGVELDTSYSRDNYKDQDTILAGYSNEGLQDMFKINNKETPVLIRVEPWVDFCDTILAEYEYTPSTGELVRK